MWNFRSNCPADNLSLRNKVSTSIDEYVKYSKSVYYNETKAAKTNILLVKSKTLYTICNASTTFIQSNVELSL